MKNAAGHCAVLLTICMTWALAPPAAGGDIAAATAADDGEKILDTLSYWRSFHMLRPAQTSLRLWKTVALPPQAKKLAEWDKNGRKIDELPVDRFLYYTFNGHWATSPILSLLSSPPPPANWFDAEFDDSTWARMRYPMMMKAAGEQMEGIDTDVALHGVASSCFRARFYVEDPARVEKLTLRVAYRGGLAAWVNGREVGRGHLVAGPIAPETSATEYEEGDYVLPPRDDLESALEGMKAFTAGDSWKGVLPKFKGQSRAIGDISGSYWEGVDQIHYYFRAPITPDEYDALMSRRDRVLQVVVDPKLLKKGLNVLALQTVRADLHPIVTMGTARMGPAAHYGWATMFKGLSWLHNCVVDVQLRSWPAGAVKAERRPAGVQLWAESPNKRLFTSEFGDPANASRLVRMIGARQGTCSGQVVLGTDKELRGLSASIGDLAGPNGARIPADAVTLRYMAARPIRDLSLLGFERSPKHDAENPMGSADIWLALWRFGPRGPDGQLPFRRTRKETVQARDAAMNDIRYFDELSPQPPATVPAGSCQPIWISVKIPADTPAGSYTGTVQVKAEGVPAEEAPLRLEVVDWKLPDPTRGEDFTTMVAMEQSPWGVAKAYQCEPWSDEHFRHIEKSLKRMGELGNDYLIIPVALNSEFGNRGDSFVVWVKGKDGKLTCDFSRFDRYMDIAQKYMPRPAVVCFGIIHPEDNYQWVVPKVLVRDEATGRTEPVSLPMGEKNPFKEGREFSDDERAAAREFLRPFVEGVVARMDKRGLKQSVFWGFVWDYTVGVERYGGVFAELAPAVKWARGFHGRGDVQKIPEPFGFQGSIVCLPQPVRRITEGPDKGKYQICSHQGWKKDVLHLSLPRTQNAVLCVVGGAVPYYWRMHPELALCGGARGICRIGADYWQATCQDGWQGGIQVGLAITCSFWPGQDEANSSARFEMLREGLQEAEARVAVEKALDGPLGQTEDGQRIQKMLDNRITSTMHIMRSYYTARPGEQDFGWQERSWDLYAAAAQATGGKAPSAADRAAFFGGQKDLRPSGQSRTTPAAAQD